MKVNTDNFRKYAEVFRKSEQRSDKELVEDLVGLGLPISEAEHFIAFIPIAFIPIAFGRAIFELSNELNITLSSYYSVYDDSEEYTLTNQPIYNIGYKIAFENRTNNLLDVDLVNKISNRSSEIVAVTKALNEKININNARLGTVSLFGFETIKGR